MATKRPLLAVVFNAAAIAGCGIVATGIDAGRCIILAACGWAGSGIVATCIWFAWLFRASFMAMASAGAAVIVATVGC